jgi:hypothetical protein
VLQTVGRQGGFKDGVLKVNIPRNGGHEVMMGDLVLVGTGGTSRLRGGGARARLTLTAGHALRIMPPEAVMTELVKMVADRAGISEDQARQAVEVVVSQLKGRLPGPLAGQIDSALAGSAGGAGGGLGGMLGGKLGL